MVHYSKLNKRRCIIIIIVILLSIVVGASVYCYKNKVSYYTSTKSYSKLNSSTTLQKSLTGKDKAIVAVLAPWCGYCTKLKKSKLLENVSKNFPVVELDDKHNEAKLVMKTVKSGGFPTLAIWRDGKLRKYNGPRTVSGLLTALK